MAERNDKTELGSGRVEAFSDAVFAVIITIMALELRAPQGHTLADVRDDGPVHLVGASACEVLAERAEGCGRRLGSGFCRLGVKIPKRS
jgi:Endosomal/lysosomal potassium channel TMEM175